MVCLQAIGQRRPGWCWHPFQQGTGQKRKCGTIVEEREEIEVEEEEGEEAVCVTFLSRKSKLGMNEVALFEYFNT
jgi:hypothetical protein